MRITTDFYIIRWMFGQQRGNIRSLSYVYYSNIQEADDEVPLLQNQENDQNPQSSVSFPIFIALLFLSKFQENNIH